MASLKEGQEGRETEEQDRAAAPRSWGAMSRMASLKDKRDKGQDNKTGGDVRGKWELPPLRSWDARPRMTSLQAQV